MGKHLPHKIYRQFPALKYKNYRLYFCGQLISFTGSWLHGVAHGWLVYQLTKSAFWLGAVSAISALPVLILSLYGGFLVDRFNRKKLLMSTQSASLIFALVLGLLTITKLINLPLLLLLTFLSGVANAIDNPVTQAFVVDVVGKEDLPSAVGLNSTMFNTGRVLGPAAAGFLIALVGVGNIFLINAASFLAILVSVYFIKINMQVIEKKENNSVHAIKEGINYSRNHPAIRSLLMTAAIGAIFCFSQATLMPVLAESVFGQGTTGLGSMLSATGLGALLGSLIISAQSKKVPPGYFIAGGNILFILSTLAFTYSRNLQVASVCLFLSGLGLTTQFSTVYSSIQKLVRDEFRGRVSSIYVLLFIGFSPIGNLLIGSTASWFGPLSAIRICLFATSVYGIVIMMLLPETRRKYATHTKRIIARYIYSFLD